ncbi:MULTISPECIES: 4,5-DOPA-extradiol-dioxygenase [Dyadobacter]|uniref:4,5-DOPA dioxygenase extradiol n=2 Tax=Dyadobacter TaxID=120831 RepID=A0A9X1PBB1_9BACT|nr:MULTISPECIES: 4,5-DOPA dioxygenase extradiol [Dyadobacter]MCF0040335.1 4,5-DOPA dioxygenase extradiol [Dyadobacter fanqingshengii]MCF2494843.1 4,5-DOPA dioxygenase extradiol [Dyadobacter chenhuakuii]MCF2519078.1 4,5-DOPA dioxygenase extradiol [Dyadobacter sp. CY351]USJ33534.1 4,5-DOPA dioxygenase extradiol [Dyadobacter chenhuakuii]USJ38707.1 4,5-DOPA dioxygenase extradiol [Dyadobacter fanqingshengii]
MTTLAAFKHFTNELPDQQRPMPVLFIGHGSPMNGIEDTAFSRRWIQMAKEIPTPAAVLVVSAHWFTNGTKITAMDFPQTIHDFGGFPPALFAVQYPAPGNPALAKEAAGLIRSAKVELNHDWGLDHGTWTVVRHMYPEAKIPVLQLSIDYTKGPQFHYDLARELMALRKKGVLIIGSGNMVHNLRMVAWDKLSVQGYGYDWALQINEQFKALIQENDHKPLINYSQLGREAALAIPTPEHYLPLMYTLGLKAGKEPVSFFNDQAVGGSLTMTSVKIG